MKGPIGMTKKISLMVLFVAFLCMGLSMPGCPGEQALQKQIDELTLKNSEATRRVQALESQVRSLNNDMGQVKLLLTQVSNTVLAQKQAIEQIETAIKAKTPKTAAKKISGKKSR